MAKIIITKNTRSDNEGVPKKVDKNPNAFLVRKPFIRMRFPESGKIRVGGMHMTEKQYGKLVEELSPRSPIWKDCLNAFWIGGLICVLGQLIQNGWAAAGLGKTDAGTATSCTLVLLSALLTGLNLYNKIARFGGAGTLVPITGFANAVVSPAIDFKSEGFVTGMAAKMFTVAGPVIVFGTLASTIYGVILMALQIF